MTDEDAVKLDYIKSSRLPKILNILKIWRRGWGADPGDYCYAEDVPFLLATLEAEQARSLKLSKSLVKTAISCGYVTSCDDCRIVFTNHSDYWVADQHNDGCIVAEALTLIAESEKPE